MGVTLKFSCSIEQNDCIEFAAIDNGLWLFMFFENADSEITNQSVCLDKATAIKFSKELRKQIALLE